MQKQPVSRRRPAAYDEALNSLRERFDSPPLAELAELFPKKTKWQIKNMYYGRTYDPLATEALKAIAEAREAQKSVRVNVMKAQASRLVPAQV